MQTDETAETNWDELLREEMDWAIAHRRGCKQDHEFRMRVRVVGPRGEIAETPLIWRNEQEKYKAMFILSSTCGIVNARAAIITSDARFLNVEGFCKRFNLAEPTKETLEEFEKGRRMVMERYGNYTGNLPADCYCDALLVIIYGPRVKRLAQTHYAEAAGALVFEPMIEGKDAAVTVGMLKAWWI